MQMASERAAILYDLADSAYDAEEIKEFSKKDMFLSSTQTSAEVIKQNLLRQDSVSLITDIQQETWPNMLEGLYQYFAFGPAIIAPEDLAGRLSAYNNTVSAEQIMKGFELNYRPVPQIGLVSSSQRAALAEMIYCGRLPTISRRKWENMTKEEAAELISSVSKPKAKIPVPVALALHAIRRLNAEERTLLDRLLINQKKEERQIA